MSVRVYSRRDLLLENDESKRVPGTSPLTAEQQDWYKARFGQRYLSVQEQPQRPPRRWRRSKRKQDLG